MNRYLIILAGLLAAISGSANAGSYFRVALLGGGELYEYRFDPSTFVLSSASRCPDRVVQKCPFFTDPIRREHWNTGNALLSRFGNKSSFSYAAADSQMRRAVIADRDPGKGLHTFEVRNLETEAIELAATTKRRISAAEMLGDRGCVLLLTSTYRIGWMPWDWPLTLAGHPPQYDTYYLEVYAPSGKMLNEMLVKENVEYSGGYLVPYREDEPDAPIVPHGPC
jgi:hypothetical protein